MNIGIYLHSSFSPTKGGGFSYQERLLSRLFCDGRISDNLILMIDLYSAAHVREEDWKYTFGAKRRLLIRPEKRGGMNSSPRGFRSLVSRFLGRPFSSSQRAVLDQHVFELCVANEIGVIFYPEQHFILTTRIPYVVNNYDLAHITAGFMPDVQRNFEHRQWFYSSVVPQALAVFCESDAGKRELTRLAAVDEKKLSVIPMFPASFVDEPVSSAQEEVILKKYSLNGKKYFFYPANYWILKNHYTLLKAFASLEEFKEVRLVLVGADKGNEKYIVRVINELLLADRVSKLGFVSNVEMKVLYQNALALVMPTYLGPTNMPILEAMALNCPVICSDFAGHREFGGEYLSYVDPADENGIADLMRRHITDDEFYRTRAMKANELYRNGRNNIECAVNETVTALLKVCHVRKSWALSEHV